MAAPGCNTHTQRAAAQAARSRPDCSGHGDLAAGARKAPKRARIGQAPKPWVGFPAESEALMSQGNLKGSPTGGFAEQAYKHRARDAGEKADLRNSKHQDGGPAGLSRSASVSRDIEARGSVRPPASRAPSDLFPWRHRPNDSGASASR